MRREERDQRRPKTPHGESDAKTSTALSLFLYTVIMNKAVYYTMNNLHVDENHEGETGV